MVHCAHATLSPSSISTGSAVFAGGLTRVTNTRTQTDRQTDIRTDAIHLARYDKTCIVIARM